MEPTVDLDKLRDEKCIPIAHELLGDMAKHLLPETPESTDPLAKMQLAVLQRTLDQKMNITMEVQYLFQLILGALSGLNATVQELDLVPVDDARFADIGRKFLQVLAETKPRMTKMTPEETAADFAEAKGKLQAIATEEGLTKLELKYLMDTIFQSFTSVNNLVADNLAKSTEKAEAKFFGIDTMSDLTVDDVNKALTNEVTVTYSPPTAAAD